MSKYTVVGDLHCKPDNLDKVTKLFGILEAMGLPVIMLGDTFDSKELIRGKCFNLVYTLLSKSKLNWIFLTGNHDWFTNECQEHSLEPLKALKNVAVVDKPMSRGSTLFLPYYRNPEDFKAVINEYSNHKYLFMHQDVINMDFGNGHISTEGNTIEDLEAFKLVISGHYHKFQDKDNLIYLGTPFSHNFGESNQDKFLGVFDDQDGSFCTIPSDFPRHVTIEVDAGNPHHFETRPEDHVRVILNGTREQLDAFDKKRYSGFKLIENCLVKVVRFDLKETESPESIFSKWYTDMKKETDLDLYNLGLSILKDSK